MNPEASFVKYLSRRASAGYAYGIAIPSEHILADYRRDTVEPTASPVALNERKG